MSAIKSPTSKPETSTYSDSIRRGTRLGLAGDPSENPTPVRVRDWFKQRKYYLFVWAVLTVATGYWFGKAVMLSVVGVSLLYLKWKFAPAAAPVLGRDILESSDDDVSNFTPPQLNTYFFQLLDQVNVDIRKINQVFDAHSSHFTDNTVKKAVTRVFMKYGWMEAVEFDALIQKLFTVVKTKKIEINYNFLLDYTTGKSDQAKLVQMIKVQAGEMSFQFEGDYQTNFIEKFVAH